MTEASIEAGFIIALSFEVLNEFTLLLKGIPYIYYLLYFKKDQIKVYALLDLGNKENVMVSVYMVSLGLKT